jgi:uncharacterized protein GlcG (DUF336 family)
VKISVLAGTVAVALLLPGRAPAQGVVTERNLSLGLAKTIAEAALAECKSKGFNTTVAVVDRAGQLLVVLRDEKATAQQVEMARRKAYTARMFRVSTLEFQKRTNDPYYAAQRNISDILALGGGVPILAGTEAIGGVGSSGSSQEQDDACAKAGIAKVAELLH